MLVALKRCVRQSEPHRATDSLRRIEDAVFADRVGRPGFEAVRREGVVLPLRRQVNRPNPAGAVFLAPLDRQLARVRSALRAEARQGVARGKGLREGRGRERFPACQVSDGGMQRLAVVRVGDVVLRLAGGVAGGALPLRQVGAGEVLHDVIGALRGDGVVVVLAREPLAVELEGRGLPGGKPQSEQIASFVQVVYNGGRGAERQDAGIGQHQQVVTLCRERGAVCQDWDVDVFRRIARRSHLEGNLPGEGLVIAGQAFVENRGLGRGGRLIGRRLD